MGRFPRSFTPSISKALQFLLCHQGSDLRRAKETIADSSMDVPGYWEDALFALGAEEAKGSGESLSPHPPTVTGCQTQAPETSAPIIYSPWPAQSRVPRRGQRHLNFFFLIILVFYLPAQPGAMESRRKKKLGGVFGDIIMKRKVFFCCFGYLVGKKNLG